MFTPPKFESGNLQFLENAASVFSGDKDAAAENKSLRNERDARHKRIGVQTMEIDFLKKT